MQSTIDPSDKLDSLQWLIEQARKSPEYGADQLNRNRMHVAERWSDELRREARGE